jgi:uncharacterized protein (TIGR02145 family)
MIKALSIISVILFTWISSLSQEITNIHFEQEGKMINIFYDLTGEGTYEVKVYKSQDGGKIWGNPLIKVSGDVGKDQVVGFGKKIIWDVLAELEKFQGDVAFKVEAISGNQTGTFIDKRDGKTYKWVKIGEQVWMAENLNYSTNSGSWCYENSTSNCAIYGRLYDWNTAKIACPSGWHLPGDQEWTILTETLGGTDVAGGKMKEAGTTHWESPNKGANNSSGFTALPGGYRYTNGGFYYLGSYGYFWSSTEYNGSNAWYRNLGSNGASVGRDGTGETYGFSLRCLKD